MAPDESTAEDSIYGGSAGRPTRGYRAQGEPQDDPQPVDEPVDEPEGESPEEDVAEGANKPLPEFPAKHREPFHGLLYLGRLEDTLEWAGHTFVVRTLTTGEHIEVGMLVKPFLGTRIEGRAYQAAMVACGIVLADGQPLYTPLGPTDAADSPRMRFEYVMKNWYPSTVNAVQGKIQELEIEAREVMESMGKASG